MEAIAEQGQIDLSATRPIEEVQSGYSRFYDGDVVIAKITPCFENGKGALIRGTLSGVGFGTTELHVLTPGPDLDGRFLYYITVDPSFRQLGAASMTGAAGQQRVPEDFVRDFRVRTPPLAQQRAIADYLDRETARLDALVAAKERVLGLLAEKRRALIARAVTQGVVSTEQPVPPARSTSFTQESQSGFDASGGEDRASAAGGDGVSAASSAQWPTKRLRYLAFRSSFDNRRTRQADIYETSFLPMEAIAEQGQIDLSAIRPIGEVQSGYSRFYDGDVVIAKITPCFENGKGALIRGTLGGVGFGTTELHVLTPGPDLDGRFLYYITVDPSFRQLGAASMTGAAGQQRVPEDFVRDFKVRTPQLPQQHAIANYLDRETANLDALATAITGTIVLLKERRSALIAAAVTGQIDIRAAS